MYVTDTEFPFYTELKSLASKLNVHTYSPKVFKLRGIGEVKLILISGLFLNYSKSKGGYDTRCQ